MGEYSQGIAAQPDGSQRIQNAARALAAARNEVMRAHSRLDEFLARGVVPGDFEPGVSASLARPFAAGARVRYT